MQPGNDTVSPSILDVGLPSFAAREVMNAEEAADFLRLSPGAFRKLAPTLPRAAIYETSGYRYLRDDLLRWLRERSDSAFDSNSGALRGTQGHKKAPLRGVKRLV